MRASTQMIGRMGLELCSCQTVVALRATGSMDASMEMARLFTQTVAYGVGNGQKANQ